MFNHLLKSTIRQFKKHLNANIINCVGLILGFTCFIFILLYTDFEMNYDNFHNDSNLIYRISTNELSEDGITEKATTNSRLRAVLKSKFPTSNVIRMDRLKGVFSLLNSELNLKQDDIFFVDSAFFNLFNFRLEKGDVNQALIKPNSIIISQKMAGYFFPNQNPLNQQIIYDKEHALTVTGVLADLPQNTHLKFTSLISFSSLQQIASHRLRSWDWPPMYTYIKFDQNPDQTQLAQVLATVVKNNYPKWQQNRTLIAQSARDIHLHSKRQNEIKENSNILMIYIIIAIGLFTLISACFNFMNFSIARSLKRAREVGIRKVIGADKRHIVTQFIGENLLVILATMLLAFILILIALPMMNQIFQTQFSFADFFQLRILIIIGLAVIFTSFLSGFYPAFYASSLQPIESIKGQLSSRKVATRLKKILVIIQFGLSAVFIITATTIDRQLDYLNEKDIGYDKQLLINIPLEEYESQIQFETFKRMIKVNPNIINITASTTVPMAENPINWPVIPDGYTIENRLNFDELGVDFDFIETYKAKIISGRNFSKEFPSDREQAFILNEAAVRKLGWSNPINKKFAVEINDPDTHKDIVKQGKVIGVIQDIHIKSLYNPVQPLYLHIVKPSYYIDYFTVRIKKVAISETLAFIKEKWDIFSPNRPFDYSFLEQRIEATYTNENNLSTFVYSYSWISIFIAVIGLFSIATISSEQRSKEFAIRKVIGAKTSQILSLIVNEFVLLIIIANLISIPIAYKWSQTWLFTFAYHIEIDWSIFILTAAVLILITLLAISTQSMRAARALPITALKFE